VGGPSTSLVKQEILQRYKGGERTAGVKRVKKKKRSRVLMGERRTDSLHGVENLARLLEL